MAEFFEGNQLVVELQNIFEEAERTLILISPFIKLHTRLKSILEQKKDNYKLEIIIVFGKNEGKEYRSFGPEEFEFFKQFPNIKICYNPNLHAKYYANEYSALLSSMNLYDYSLNNNIEFGVKTKTKDMLVDMLGIGHDLDEKAHQFFMGVIKQSDSVIKYHKIPQFEKKTLGLAKKFIDSSVIIDELTDSYIETVAKRRKVKEVVEKGFCIRTGETIPYNPKQPMSKTAYDIWKKFSNQDYPEKYCHKTGNESNGKTSMRNPVLA
ncbi:phospholipase D family protein [Flavobacterium sp. ASW18X]|uniref:phospholipase D family protein n=1 Tax=Flavobacterium sp. ASW18X TaxID=2572595 RepID=UPI0010AEB113|nr:phospholipase D family protein [Flavobacterium sp. ASW18X]TKD66527.1 hypothetical protein FBT53_01335 [Flavobacterium sp. ASW18X]